MKNKSIIVILIVLAAIAAFIYYSQNRSTIRKELSDFAVEDTASITKIFLVDNESKSVLLERVGNENWTVNGKFEARQDAVNVLLTTIKRVAVKTPVQKSAFENVVKQIASKHVKIQIYQNGDKPLKSYYVGHSNPEHSGTYMLLENSSVPFLMHIEGFRGFLTPRYFTNENDWRNTGIFNYGYGEIASIKLEYPDKPENSFLITDLGNNKFILKSLVNNLEISDYDSTLVMQYVSLYQNIHFEGFEETKTAQFKDSVLITTPLQKFSVTGKNGVVKTLKTFLKPLPGGATDLEGNPVKNDLERFYGLVDEKDFVVLQYFVFDPLFKIADDFGKKRGLPIGNKE